MKDGSLKSNAAKAAVAVLLGCFSSLVIGCSSSQFLSSADNSSILAAALQGKVHGGRQPINGASVQLWAVGSSGYGSAASKLGTSVSTDSNGNFSLGAYTCPTASTLTYITASGGNSGSGSNNANSMLAAALGACGNLNSGTYIVLNELSTAAAAFALGQYFTPAIGGPSTGDSFGAPNTTQAQAGIANGFGTFNNLACAVSNNTVCGLPAVAASGNAVTTATFASGCASPATAANPCVSVTATPEAQKLNAIADILASCVNSTGVADPIGTCTTLFNGVVTSTGTAPTDTLQAAVYMSLNPTSNNANGSTTNLAALYALVTAQGSPYPTTQAQPTDWTVGIQYTDATAGTFLLIPQNIAADASGNIWVVNGTSPGSLVELSPTGTPVINGLTSSTAGSGLNGASPRNLAIDLSGNPWVTSSTSAAYIYEYLPGTNTFNTATTSKSSYGIAIDGSNNVYVGSASTSSHFELYEFPGANIATPIVYPIASATPGTAGANGTNGFVLPEYMAVDTSGNLWMTNGSGTTATSSNYVVQLSNINISACNAYAGTYPCPAGSTSGTPLPTSVSENTFTGLNPAAASMAAPFGIAASTNGMWVANSTTGSNSVSNVSLSGASGATYGSSTSVTSPRYVAVDGAGNIWVTSKTTASPGAVSEFGASGSILSPVAGTAPFSVGGFSHSGLVASLGVTIDPTGNVWVANNTTTGGIFEMVGAAAPTVTPIALALKNGTVAAKP